jgi:hypothetical protein
MLPAISHNGHTSSSIFRRPDEDLQRRIELFHENQLEANFKRTKLQISLIPSNVSPEAALFWRTFLESSDRTSSSPFSGVEKEPSPSAELVNVSEEKRSPSSMSRFNSTKATQSQSISPQLDLYHLQSTTSEESMSTSPPSNDSPVFVPRAGFTLVNAKISKKLDDELKKSFVYLQKYCLNPLAEYSKDNVARRTRLAKIERVAEYVEPPSLQGKKKSSEQSAVLTRNRALAKVVKVIALIPDPQNSFLPIKLAEKVIKFAHVINEAAACFRNKTSSKRRNLFLFADSLLKLDPETNRFIKVIENSLPVEDYENSKVWQQRSELASKRKAASGAYSVSLDFSPSAKRPRTD